MKINASRHTTVTVSSQLLLVAYQQLNMIAGISLSASFFLRSPQQQRLPVSIFGIIN
jgi:hypothetical protein